MAGSHAHLTAESLAAQLERPRRSGEGWMACCPAHDDSTPSLKIDDGDSGKLLLRCHGGCDQRAVLDALEARGIRLNGQAAPMAAARQRTTPKQPPKPAAIIPVPEGADAEFQPPAGAQHRFDFRDLDGRLHFIVTREDRPKQPGASSSKDHEKRPLPWIYTAQGWRNLAPPRGRIPLGLPDLAKSPTDRRVFIVQGELKRDVFQKWLNAARFKEAVLTGMGGDASVLLTDWSALAARKVAIWPDNDDSGRKAAQQLAAHLHALGCRSIRVLDPPAGLGPSEDVHDLIKRDQLTTELLKGMLKATPEWSPPPPEPPAVATSQDTARDEERAAAPASEDSGYRRRPLDWRQLAGQTPPERDWAIPGWLGLGHATLLAGEGGSGKSLITQATATALAAGKPYFFDSPAASRICLMWAGEDDRDELWRRQTAINGYFGLDMRELAAGLYLEPFDGRDMLLATPSIQMPGQLLATPMLTELREQVGDYCADVVILDTVARIFGGSENDRGHVTRFIAMLLGAMPHPVALLLLAHPSRTAGAEFSGSSAWEGSVRSRLFFGRRLPDAKPEDTDEQDDTVRFLARRKANYSGRDWAAFNYDPERHVLVPQTTSSGDDFYRHHHARDVLRNGLRELLRQNLGHPTARASSHNLYLPKMIRVNGLNRGVSEIELRRALNALLQEGKLREVDGVAKDRAGRPRSGLVIQD